MDKYDTPFWREMPRHVCDSFTHTDPDLYGETVRTGVRLLEACRNIGVPWPDTVQFDECHMYMLWSASCRQLQEMTEVIVFEDELWVDAQYPVTEERKSFNHVVTWLKRVTSVS